MKIVGIIFPVQSHLRERISVSPTNLKHQASKRFACPKPNDVSQGLNSIDQRLISDYAHSLEFLPDHQSGRTNDNHHVSPQNKDFTKFHLNESKKPSLLNRITLPLQDNDQTYNHTN
ncbi:hypothetical protein KEM48_010441 [Puccinia striiformis f. sp. tritici PST-130]|nr:hypothetical protein KEM48_010441 [Puccinia striiformis f. sp. tritici PST-130]